MRPGLSDPSAAEQAVIKAVRQAELFVFLRPHRHEMFDEQIRPGPVPGRAASLLPGLLAATRAGLPPAGDDEHRNAKIRHGSTSRCHLPFSWAHE